MFHKEAESQPAQCAWGWYFRPCSSSELESCLMWIHQMLLSLPSSLRCRRPCKMGVEGNRHPSVQVMRPGLRTAAGRELLLNRAPWVLRAELSEALGPELRVWASWVCTVSRPQTALRTLSVLFLTHAIGLKFIWVTRYAWITTTTTTKERIVLSDLHLDYDSYQP